MPAWAAFVRLSKEFTTQENLKATSFNVVKNINHYASLLSKALCLAHSSPVILLSATGVLSLHSIS